MSKMQIKPNIASIDFINLVYSYFANRVIQPLPLLGDIASIDNYRPLWK